MRSAESIKQSNEMRDKIIDILEQNQGMKAVYPLLHYFESQFREPSTQGGERHKKEVDDAWIAGVMSERSAAKDEIDRLKQESERLKEEIDQFRDHTKKLHEQNDKIRSVLEGYERWEADILSEDKLWMPCRAKDVFTGPIYDKMLELQAKRNEALNPQD